MKLDAKSIVFGLILGCLLMFALGAARPVDLTPRYQIAIASDWDPFVIDQKTGSVWIIKDNRSWKHVILGPPMMPPPP